MLIAGLQRLSLVDFPQHLAAVVFVQGCNFRCGYCHNPDLIPPKGPFHCDTEEMLRELAARKNVVEGVVISGGEPAMHPDLPDLLRRIKDMGFLTKVDTNGSNPDLLSALVRDRLVDYVAMDIKTSPGRYSLVTDMEGIADTITESVRWLMLSTVPYEFRTTCVPGIVGDDDLRLIAELVKGAKKYCLQQFNPTVTLDGAFRSIKPYGAGDMQRFREILAEKADIVEIRGL